MNKVICPNCRTVTPPWKYCAKCNAPLDYLLSQPVAEEPAARPCAMDPHLHRLIQRVRNQGISKLKTASTDQDWITVIARVSDLDAFKALDEVVIGVDIPPVQAKTGGRKPQRNEKHEEDKSTIVTARMPLRIVEDVRRQPFVCSLKAGQRVRPWLEQTRKTTRAGQSSGSKRKRPVVVAETPGRGGEGVIVGIVDFGMDFMHKNFRNDDGTSRILAIWDQTSAGNPRYMQHLGYGNLYTQADINAAINASISEGNKGNAEMVCNAAYRALGYGPPPDSLFLIGAHGTYVADVAAGNGSGTGISGFAPKAGIVFVEISTQPGAPMIGQSFGDSAQLLEAVKFIFDYADKENKPCVINLSLGTNGGPHDGSTLVEQAIDRLLSDPDKPGRAVIVAAGNAFGQDLHAVGSVKPGGSAEIKWLIPKNDSTPNELEVWYDAEDRFTVEVVDPDGKSLATVAPGWQVDLSDNCRGFMTIVNRLDDPNNHDNTINIFFESGVRSGEWTLRIHGAVVSNGEFHAWIERDETGQARFIKPKPEEEKGIRIDNCCTLGSIACGRKTISVGSFDARKTDEPKVSKTTSAGPTRDGRQKPDIAAPGELVMAARSRTLILRNRVSGTSISAAVVTGIAALIMSEAGYLTADDISEILTKTASRDTLATIEKSAGRDLKAQLGRGCVSVEAALSEVAERAPDHSASKSKSKK